MFPQAWQVGLDIQSHCVRALAAQRHRNGWQLRHWWQQILPEPVLRDGYLEKSDLLTAVLKPWRTRLPKNISLRIALPAQRILQHHLPLPDSRLQEPARHGYITTQGLKKFPLDSQTLVMDYRLTPPNTSQLLLTAARQQEIQQWLLCLQHADLQPEAIDITPSALSNMATFAGLAADAGLLHRLEEEWLWVAPRDAPFAFGMLPTRETGDPRQALVAMRTAYPALGERDVYYSSVLDEVLPEGVTPWSPLTAFRQLHPPLPVLPMAFVLAGGLALRCEDY